MPRPLPLLCLLLSLCLGACSGLLPGEPPRVQLVGLQPLPGAELEARFELLLRVQNPSPRALRYRGLDLELEVNGQPLASGVSDQQGEIAPYGEGLLRLPVSLSALNLLRQAWSLGQGGPRKALPYRLRGRLGGWLGGRGFESSGELDWPQPQTRPAQP